MATLTMAILTKAIPTGYTCHDYTNRSFNLLRPSSAPRVATWRPGSGARPKHCSSAPPPPPPNGPTPLTPPPPPPLARRRDGAPPRRRVPRRPSVGARLSCWEIDCELKSRRARVRGRVRVSVTLAITLTLSLTLTRSARARVKCVWYLLRLYFTNYGSTYHGAGA